ncbi:MAG TPA: ABC transporter substrate-binding protein [Acidimicrobiales bacterium]|nr:ABC transporter substrate-binding protein [Acidimicrobiales bacterium]
MPRLHLRRAATLAAAASLCLGLTVTGMAVGATRAPLTPPTPGVTAHSITIGATVPLTGIASTGYNEVAKAANAVFKYVDSKGGINGRIIHYILKDDCYDVQGFGCSNGGATTVSQTQALLALPVFATVGSLGTPTQDSVRILLRTHGVPQLFVNSGSSDWNAPKTYPGLFGWQPSYVVESKILAKFIMHKWPGEKVCFLGQNDDFGRNGLAGLEYEHLRPAIQQMYSVSGLVGGGAGYFTPFINAEKSAGCKVVFLDTIPGATGAALGNAAALSYHPNWVISGVGADPITVKKATGVSDVGAFSFGYLPASTEATSWHSWMYKVLEADQADFKGFTAKSPLDGNMEYGIGFGVSFVEALRAAGPTFTRASFLKTLLTTTFDTSAVVPLQYSPSNHQGLQGGFVVEVKSNTQTEVWPPGTVWSTTSAASSPIVVTKAVSSGIPSWLLPG